MSLASPVGETSVLEDFLEDQATPTPLEMALGQELAEEVRRGVEALPSREGEILRLRFGLGDEKEHTLEEVGARLGVTRERVRQLQERALQRLTGWIQGEAL